MPGYSSDTPMSGSFARGRTVTTMIPLNRLRPGTRDVSCTSGWVSDMGQNNCTMVPRDWACMMDVVKQIYMPPAHARRAAASAENTNADLYASRAPSLRLPCIECKNRHIYMAWRPWWNSERGLKQSIMRRPRVYVGHEDKRRRRPPRH